MFDIHRIEFTCVLAEIMRVSAFELLIFVPDYGNVKSVKGKPSKLYIDTFCAMNMFISVGSHCQLYLT